MKTATKQKCEAYARENNLTIELEIVKHSGFREFNYSVDLPTGLMTELGYTGLAGNHDDGDMSLPELWHYIMEDMQALAAEKWIDNSDS